MSYTIDEFWLGRLGGVRRSTSSLPLAGWSVEPQTNPFFVEADLTWRADSGSLDTPTLHGGPTAGRLIHRFYSLLRRELLGNRL
jgi:hypothetical protein